MVGDLKFDAATQPNRVPIARSGLGLTRRYCRPAAWTKVLNGESHGSNHSREGQDPSSSRGWPANRGRHRAGAPRTARPGGQARHRDHDGRQQTANSLSPRPRTHGLTSGGPGSRATKKEKPRRSGAFKFWDKRAQRVIMELVPSHQCRASFAVPSRRKYFRFRASVSRRNAPAPDLASRSPRARLDFRGLKPTGTRSGSDPLDLASASST